MNSLKKVTTGALGHQSKKIDAILAARFDSLNDLDRVKRIRMNSDKIMKVWMVHL